MLSSQRPRNSSDSDAAQQERQDLLHNEDNIDDDEDAQLAEADADYIRDVKDRRGLPVIPRGAPPVGDRIDLDRIHDEYATRATKRASPASMGIGGGTSAAAKSQQAAIPLRSVTTSTGSAVFQQIPQSQLSTSQVRHESLDDAAYSYEAPQRRITHKRLPKKTAFTAGFLLFVGVVFSTLGLSFLFTLGLHDALPFLILGGIGFIPGSYVSFIIYQTWNGVPGYSYDQIPTYDD